jgi:raffinose/stachyose/melibiose transport system permease protein
MNRPSKYFVRLILLFNGLAFFFPLYWMINLSFKEKSEVYVNPFGLPSVLDTKNYSEVLDKFDFFKYLMNSAIYTVATVIIVILFGSMLAYALTRMQWKHSSWARTYISMGLIIPVQVIIIPLFLMVHTLHLNDTYLSLILPYSAFSLSSCVLMLSAFFRSLPRELEEAAYIDGCNVYSAFFRIIIPAVRPAIATQVVLIFINIWNEFFLAFIMGAREGIRPLPVALLNFFTSIGVSDWGQIGAVMILASIPTALIYMFAYKQIEKALTAGSILK